MLTQEQLAAAWKEYAKKHKGEDLATIPMQDVRRVISRHWQRCLRMPAGGAHGGGSMQTGFELELFPEETAIELFADWPHFQRSATNVSWECRSMEDCAHYLNLQLWGWGNAKLAPPIQGSEEHSTVILAGPPLTCTLTTRSDGSTLLALRAPIILYTEDDAIILPPADANGVPFYVDPPDQPGMHSDLFKAGARRALGELSNMGFTLTENFK